jgi:hypothetical protein
MKKILTSAILFVILLIPSLAEAQAPTPPDVPTLGPSLTILSSGDENTNVKIISPIVQKNYPAGELKLTVSIEAVGMLGQFGNVGYSLDGGTIYSIKNLAKSVDDKTGYPDWYWWKTTAGASLSLPNLSDGFHTITVYYGWQYPGDLSVSAYTTVDFSIGNSNATPEIYIRSPTDKSFTQKNSTLLSFYLEQVHNMARQAFIYYSLDGKNYSVSNIDEAGIKTVINNVTPFNQEIVNLTDGLHSLCVYVQVYYLHDWLFEGNSSIQFTVDTSSPTITELSVANKTYSSQNIALSFSLNENASWIAYNLDNQGNVTLQGNTTLTGISFGSHNIVVYANDTSGNIGKAGPIYFEVKPAEFLTFANLIIIVVIVAFVISLLLFRRHRKTINQSK